jgi:hypothetical protein
MTSNIYINKKQLSILKIALMSLTRDDEMFEFAIENGVFSEDDIHSYIETLGLVVDSLSEAEGMLMVSEIDLDTIMECSDLWGNSINGAAN